MSDPLVPSGQTPEPERDDETPVDSAVSELLAAFALGATDAGESTCIARRLAREPDMAQRLAPYIELTELLLYSAPPAAVPPALAGWLSKALTEPAAISVHPPRSAPVAGPVTGPVTTPRRWHWPQLAAVAAALVLVALNLYWLREIFSLRDQQAELNERLATQDQLLAALVATTGERYTMKAAQPGSPAMAQVAWLPDSQLAVLRALDFPALEKGKAYQLWLIKDGLRTSGGLFTVGAEGEGTFVFTPPTSLDDFDGMGITPEPETGSLGPTAPPVVTAKL